MNLSLLSSLSPPIVTAPRPLTCFQAVRRASVGETLAARIAGQSGDRAITIAAPIPPAHASAGITTAQFLLEA